MLCGILCLQCCLKHNRHIFEFALFSWQHATHWWKQFCVVSMLTVYFSNELPETLAVYLSLYIVYQAKAPIKQVFAIMTKHFDFAQCYQKASSIFQVLLWRIIALCFLNNIMLTSQWKEFFVYFIRIILYFVRNTISIHFNMLHSFIVLFSEIKGLKLILFARLHPM